MRFATLLRTSLTVAAFGALAATDAGAQKRNFEESWFWGLDGGGTAFSTSKMQDVVAPGFGFHTLITREHAALHVGFMQYYFDSFAALNDEASGTTRTVGIKNMRTLGASVYVFPRAYGSLRPYGGLGMNFNLIQQTAVAGAFTTPQQRDSVNFMVEQNRTAVVPEFTLGIQSRFIGGLHLFVEGGVMPGRPTSFFDNGANYTFQGGIRYNIGAAREEPR